MNIVQSPRWGKCGSPSFSASKGFVGISSAECLTQSSHSVKVIAIPFYESMSKERKSPTPFCSDIKKYNILRCFQNCSRRFSNSFLSVSKFGEGSSLYSKKGSSGQQDQLWTSIRQVSALTAIGHHWGPLASLHRLTFTCTVTSSRWRNQILTALKQEFTYNASCMKCQNISDDLNCR